MKVTGVVDLSLKTWRNEPFGLRLETLQVLSPDGFAVSWSLWLIFGTTLIKKSKRRSIPQALRGGTLHLAVRPHGYGEGEPEKGGSLSVTYKNGGT